MSDMKWYTTSVEINLVNEPYEERKRKKQASTGMIEARHGKWAYQIKGLRRWDQSWIFNTVTMELKPAK
jgi:hypothetical protein